MQIPTHSTPISQTKKILIITHELNPYMRLTEAGDTIQHLINTVKNQDKSIEVRVIMPKYDIISDRKYRLHNVLRFANLKVALNKENYDFISVKVSSIPDVNKTQVYFLDNDNFFRKKSFSKPLPNIHDTLIFFAKSAVVLAKELNWSPDVIHCYDWYTGLIPFYLNTYKSYKNILKKNGNIILSLFDLPTMTPFDEKKQSYVDEKAYLDQTLTKNIAQISTADFFSQVGMHYANQIIAQDILKKHQHFQKNNPIVIYTTKEQQLNDHLDLYTNQIEKNSLPE